ncbi:glycosyltransferase family 4 protein [Clostridium culturomicium]|uniref:glycosyltransferase family 4 protein n=1 Tax=Clostridium culturomicium TaxID=1499683 RepID=UPI003857A879
MKKICFITQCSLPIPTVRGGAVETLVEYILNENEKSGEFQFTVISIGDEKVEKLSEKYKYTDFIYINPKKKSLNKILLFVYKVLKRINIYIPFSLEFKEALKIIGNLKEQDLYIFEAGPTTQLPALSKIIPKEKLLVHIHWDGMANRKKDKCFSYLLPVSDYIGNQWKDKSGCSSDKIIPLYNCAKIERFNRDSTLAKKEELRKKLEIPNGNKVIIFTGRIVQEKGIRELLKAFEQLKTKKVTLLIIGSANFGAKTNTFYEKEIANLIEKSCRSIIFTGYVHQTELYKYYNIADIAVMPSMFQDPAPLVCIETQATGTPLIATNVGGIREYSCKEGVILIEKDENLVNNLAKEMDSLLDNEQLIKEMGEKNKQYIKQFDTEQYFNQFCKVLKRIDNESK